MASDFASLLKYAKDDNEANHQSNLLLDINERKLMNDSHSLMS